MAVAAAWARVRVQLADARRRANVNDMWIGATALALGVPVVTRDRDFDVIAEVCGLDVVRVQGQGALLTGNRQYSFGN